MQTCRHLISRIYMLMCFNKKKKNLIFPFVDMVHFTFRLLSCVSIHPSMFQQNMEKIVIFSLSFLNHLAWHAFGHWYFCTSFCSIWTVDLAYLLHKFSVDFSFLTVTLGANPDYSAESYYRVSAQSKSSFQQIYVIFCILKFFRTVEEASYFLEYMQIHVTLFYCG